MSSPLSAELNKKWAGYPTGMYSYLIKNNRINIKTSINGAGSQFYIDTQEFNSLRINSENYIISHFFGTDQIIIYGGGWIFFKSEIHRLNCYNPTLSTLNLIQNGINEYDDFLIESVSSNSWLKEGNVQYHPDGLLHTFTIDTHFYSFNTWNHELIPWAEGEDGSGIGVTLDITYKEPTDHLLVINGYVDFGKMYLYKANNRVKDAIFRSQDPENPFEITHTFEDVVNIHEVDFPEPVKKVQMEIVSVYPGEKWDDTVITGMLTRNPDADYYYNKFKDTFFNGAIQYKPGMEIEWDEPIQ
jgi:hypothetical protein